MSLEQSGYIRGYYVGFDDGFADGARSRQAEIDELKAKLTKMGEAVGLNTQGVNTICGVLGYRDEVLARADAAEAKLAIAVDALKRFPWRGHWPCPAPHSTVANDAMRWDADVCGWALAQIESAKKDGE